MEDRIGVPALRELLDEGWPPSSLPGVEGLALRVISQFATDDRPREARAVSYRRILAACVRSREEGTWDDPTEVMYWSWVVECVEHPELAARFVAGLEPELRAECEADRTDAFAAMAVEEAFR